MGDWLDIYRNENDFVQIHLANKNLKLKQPQGYTDAAFNDIDNGNYLPVSKEGAKGNAAVSHNKIQNHELKEFKKKKMWELATSPAKSILMNVGMSYMSPNDIQVIPIMMLFMLFINTFKEMFMVNLKFKQLDSNIESKIDSYDVNIMKFLYILSCCGNLLVGLWKLYSMGLIPNKSSDWLGWEHPLKSAEVIV